MPRKILGERVCPICNSNNAKKWRTCVGWDCYLCSACSLRESAHVERGAKLLLGLRYGDQASLHIPERGSNAFKKAMAHHMIKTADHDCTTPASTGEKKNADCGECAAK